MVPELYTSTEVKEMAERLSEWKSQYLEDIKPFSRGEVCGSLHATDSYLRGYHILGLDYNRYVSDALHTGEYCREAMLDWIERAAKELFARMHYQVKYLGNEDADRGHGIVFRRLYEFVVVMGFGEVLPVLSDQIVEKYNFAKDNFPYDEDVEDDYKYDGHQYQYQYQYSRFGFGYLPVYNYLCVVPPAAEQEEEMESAESSFTPSPLSISDNWPSRKRRASESDDVSGASHVAPASVREREFRHGYKCKRPRLAEMPPPPPRANHGDEDDEVEEGEIK